MPNITGVTSVDAYIGEKIRGYRNQLQISQAELGDKLGVSFQQIQKYEKGVNRVSGTRMMQIAQVFDIDVADLLPEQPGNGSGKKKPKLSNVDRMVATRDGSKLVDSFVTIKDENLRAAVVDLARRFENL
jgi:transcriptional regulator with XRE-family HTH domain